MHRLIVVFLLGIAEGLTEFFPISSTGHIIFINSLLGNTHNVDKIFIVFVQLGAIFSILLIFWHRLYYMGIVCVTRLFVLQRKKRHRLCCIHILLGTLPGMIVGVFFFEKIGLIFDFIHIVYGLIIGGIFLFIADRYSPKVSCVLHIDNITYLQAFLIGCFQCLAFWPGFSRAGATIGGGMLVGLNRRTSLEFSFFLAIPIIFGATILTIYRCKYHISAMDILSLFVGCVTAFGVAICTVKFFLKIVKNISFIPFVIYRFLLAGSIYWVLII